MHIKVSTLFRHYIDVLAPWYDLCDEDQYFGSIVPMHALEEPTLFRVMIACSACHTGRLSSGIEELGMIFHAACVQDMLAIMDDFPHTFHGGYLAATYLLRSDEILTGITITVNISMQLLTVIRRFKKRAESLLGAYTVLCIRDCRYECK